MKKLFLAFLLMLPLAVLAKPVTVGVDFNRSGTMRLLVGVANDGVADFTVDTGASGVLMPSTLMKDLEKRGVAHKVGEQKSQIADGRVVVVDLYEVDSVNIMGACEVKKVVVSAIRGKDGMFLLGMDVLSRLSPLTIDTNKRTITFECAE